MNRPALLGLDWGSSHLRAWRLDADGRVLDQRSNDNGASRLPSDPAAFEGALRGLVGDWLQAEPPLPVIACGMVGSAHGWREAPYAACPLLLDDLHRHLLTVKGSGGLQLALVPGLSYAPPEHPPDVLRGEETQLAGLLQRHPRLAAEACVVMPGTHSKWVEMREGRVKGFATRMTGELFALLREHSVLGRLMRPTTGFDEEAFVLGVRAADARHGADLGRLLFSVRTLGLFDLLPRESLGDYLSGLLIGCEVVCGLGDKRTAELPLVLLGEPVLCARYALAFATLHRQALVPPDDALAARGLWHLASCAGLITAQAGPG